MSDPLVLNGQMPSEEYLRYTAFWAMQIKAVLLAEIAVVVSAILANAAAQYWAMRRALRKDRGETGGRVAD